MFRLNNYSMYLYSITILRAIAILLIVGSHCHSISNIMPSNFIHRLLINITAGGTVVFVFLSGFLYHHIFYLKGRTNIFLKKRAIRLLIPYLILSIIPILYRIFSEPNFWSSFIPSEKTGILNEYLYPIFLFLISGDHLVAYWYIPFAMLLFLCYPLHTIFIETNHKGLNIGKHFFCFTHSSETFPLKFIIYTVPRIFNSCLSIWYLLFYK